MYPILGIDQGTTSTKAYRAEAAGEAAMFVGSRAHRQFHPRPGWVEHDPAALLADIRALIEAAGPVATIGLANQGETVVAWDAVSSRPLGSAIVWQDDRTRAVTDRMRADGLEPVTLERSGLPLDPYFSATKLRWLLDHAEDAAALRRQGRLRLGTSDAFFIDALTGNFFTDVSTASRTGLMNLRRLEWDETLCGLFGVPAECLPEIRPTVGPFGLLPGGAVLGASAVDQQAALYGHGCRLAGDIKITFGTGAFALGLTDGAGLADRRSGLLPTVAWRIGDRAARYALEGGVLTAGSAADWARGIGLFGDFTELDELPGESAAARGLFFVPAQGGLGCPYWDRTARASWIGIGLDTSREDLARAVLEGVALRAAQLVDAFAAGSTIGRISIDGGLSRSRGFTRFLANALGQPIEVAETPDLTASGIIGLCGAAGPEPPRPRTRWRTMEPGAAGLQDIRRRFADAVERSRSWA